MKLKFLTSVVLSTTLMACAGNSGNAESGTTTTKTVTVNGEAPEVYFKRFVYHTTGKCSDQGGMYFHFLSTFDDKIELPQAPDGKVRYASLAIYLSDDGTYEADYEKWIWLEKNGDVVRYRRTSIERLKGKSRLNEDGTMSVEGIGQLSGVTYNEKPAVFLTLENPVLSEDVANPNILLSMVMSTAGREPYNVVCPGAY